MARHSQSVNISLDHWKSPKRGRPVADKPLSGPHCKLCRHLDLSKLGPAGCMKGFSLDAEKCGEFKDSSVQRYDLGGVSGLMFQR